MRVRNFLMVLLITVMSLNYPQVVRASERTDYKELAAYWAPQIYQDVNAGFDVRADFITRFDYDGDWAGNNNWENVFDYPLEAYVYYSLQETDTHYFIGYYFFYPRDDAEFSVDRHENDWEGMMVVIQKDGSEFGSFQLMETSSHADMFQYTNDSTIGEGYEDIEGSIMFEGNHPKVYVTCNGLGSKHGHGTAAYEGESAPGDNGLVYYYKGEAEVPTDVEGNFTKQYGYDLLSIDEIWDRRYDIGEGHTFGEYGAFNGDNFKENAAHAPWIWGGTDGIGDGIIFSDPAFYIDAHFTGFEDFSHNYIYNPYYSHKITVENVTSLSNEDTFSDGSDIFVKVTVADNEVIGHQHWKWSEAENNSVKPVFWGQRDAEKGNPFSCDFNYIYVASPHDSEVVIEIRDRDPGSDESMGSISTSLAPGETITWVNENTSKDEAQVSAIVEANEE